MADTWHLHTSKNVNFVDANGDKHIELVQEGPSSGDKNYHRDSIETEMPGGKGVTAIQVDLIHGAKVNFYNSKGAVNPSLWIVVVWRQAGPDIFKKNKGKAVQSSHPIILEKQLSSIAVEYAIFAA